MFGCGKENRLHFHNVCMHVHTDTLLPSLWPSNPTVITLCTMVTRGVTAMYDANPSRVCHRVTSVRENGICHYEIFFETPLHCRWVMTPPHPIHPPIHSSFGQPTTHLLTHRSTHPFNQSTCHSHWVSAARSTCATWKGFTSATTGDPHDCCALIPACIRIQPDAHVHTMHAFRRDVRSESATESDAEVTARADEQDTGADEHKEL